MKLIQCDVCGTTVPEEEGTGITYIPAKEDDARPCFKIKSDFYTYKTEKKFDLCSECGAKLLKILTHENVRNPDGTIVNVSWPEEKEI